MPSPNWRRYRCDRCGEAFNSYVPGDVCAVCQFLGAHITVIAAAPPTERER